MRGFIVIDNQTGKLPDIEGIALHEEWANDLCYCDLEGFAVLDDGRLVLLDECGRFAYCPEGRFTVAEVEAGIFDKEETYPNCTVQVLTNTATGEVSVGWWENGGAVE